MPRVVDFINGALSMNKIIIGNNLLLILSLEINF